MQVRYLGGEDPLEKEMTTHSSIFAWRIPWTEELGGQQSMGLQRVGHDWSDLAPRLAHQSLELDSEPVLSEGKAFSPFPRRYHLLCILTCIKCYFNTNSRPWIKMPVPWVGLAVLFLFLFFSKDQIQRRRIQRSGEAVEAVNQGFWPTDALNARASPLRLEGVSCYSHPSGVSSSQWVTWGGYCSFNLGSGPALESIVIQASEMMSDHLWGGALQALSPQLRGKHRFLLCLWIIEALRTNTVSTDDSVSWSKGKWW